MMAAIDPGSALRRSQLIGWHAEQGAVYTELADSAFVDRYKSTRDEASDAAQLGICDLSLLPRQGVTGPGSVEFLQANGYQLPAKANTSVRQTSGNLLSRLSPQEFLRIELSHIFAKPGNGDIPNFHVGSDDRVYDVPRVDSHCLFSVCGNAAAFMFAKLCGVDLRSHKFADGDVAQTSVARVNAIVIRHDLGASDNYFLLIATPAAEYLWECLLDAIGEYDGRAVGVAALQAVAKAYSGEAK